MPLTHYPAVAEHELSRNDRFEQNLQAGLLYAISGHLSVVALTQQAHGKSLIAADTLDMANACLLAGRATHLHKQGESYI